MTQSSAFVCFALFFLLSVSTSEALKFLSIGDWGCSKYSGYSGAVAKFNVQKNLTAQKFEEFARHNISTTDGFVLNLGDSFYRCGVHGTDDPQWGAAWVDAFPYSSRQFNWYGVLGNHEYGFMNSPKFVVDMTTENLSHKLTGTTDSWQMPGRYYYKRLESEEVNISLIALDSSPCQDEYRTGNKVDPKACQHKEEDVFTKQINEENCTAQAAWLENLMRDLKDNKRYRHDWFVVIVHAPMYDVDLPTNNTLYDIIMRYGGVDVVLNGHIHKWEHYSISSASPVMITNGCGCHDEAKSSHDGDDDFESHPLGAVKRMWHQTPKGGFMIHDLDVASNTMTHRFIAEDGSERHVITHGKIRKQ